MKLFMDEVLPRDRQLFFADCGNLFFQTVYKALQSIGDKTASLASRLTDAVQFYIVVRARLVVVVAQQVARGRCEAVFYHHVIFKQASGSSISIATWGN